MNSKLRIHYKLLGLLNIALLFSSFTWSQNSIEGRVVGKDTNVSFVNIIIFKAIDSSLVKGNISDENGAYSFDNIKDGRYFITASMMGFTNVSTEVFELKNQSTLKMKDIVFGEQVVLDEVVLNIEKPLYEQKVDRMVINVQSSILSAGSTALQVLERSPGVNINRQNNNISLIGKSGVTIMINGKISYLPQASISFGIQI